MSDFVKIPYFSVSPDRVSVYERYADPCPHREDRSKNSLDNLKNNKPDPQLSEAAKKRIKLALDWLLYLSRPKKAYNKATGKTFQFRIAFITLTLASEQIHTDIEIKSKLLNTFLTYLRRQYRVKHYVWRAEKQANGNIHFHITIDKYVPWWELRDAWNRIQDNLGYVSRYTQRFEKMSFEDYCILAFRNGQKSITKIKKAYDFGCLTKWLTPNSTDIHSVIKIDDLSAYLSKYCTKAPKHGFIEGDQWRLSRTLSKFKNVVEILAGSYDRELSQIWNKYRDKVKEYDYAAVLYIPINILFSESPISIINLVDNYVASRLAQPS